MNRRSATKPYWEMTTDELREATKEFDREYVAGSAKPLSAAMRSRWTKAKAKLPAGTALQRLEIQIDECVEMARSLHRDGLESVIHLLRSAAIKSS